MICVYQELCHYVITSTPHLLRLYCLHVRFLYILLSDNFIKFFPQNKRQAINIKRSGGKNTLLKAGVLCLELYT
jgi:hypothetical protein